MDTLILCGSGNPEGYTHAVCRKLAERMGNGTEIVFLGASDIGDCTGCGGCRKNGICVLKDDMPYDRLGSADTVILATPLHFNGCSSILKRSIDRLNPYWYGKGSVQGRAYGIVIGGSKEPVFRHALSEMRSGCAALKKKWMGECLVPDTDDTEPDIDLIMEKVLSDLEVDRDGTGLDRP
ncbi:MAG: flavodoxin family protein [archaeon]|nr:flavodoxin family protein [archaeon]